MLQIIDRRSLTNAGLLTAAALIMFSAACSDNGAFTEPPARTARAQTAESGKQSITPFTLTGHRLVSYASGLCLEPVGPNYATNGLDVIQDVCFDASDPSPQRWVLTFVGTGPISGRSGTFNLYHIVNQVNGQCLDDRDGNTADRAPVQLWPCNTTSSTMKWTLGASNAAGYTQLINERSGKCLDDPNRTTTVGVAMWQYTCTGTTNEAQVWAFQ